MTDAWAKFWIALALMALAGGIFTNAVIGSPFELGALAQWAAALATTSAVWVALRNTKATLVETERREAKKQKAADETYVKAVKILALQVSVALDIIEQHAGKSKISTDKLAFISKTTHLDGLSSSVDRMPLHVDPDPSLLVILTNIRIGAMNAKVYIDLAVEKGEPAMISVEHEKVLLKQAVDALQYMYPDL